MIISCPTGLYDTVLPKVPSDPTSVIYTVSSTEPPRGTLNFMPIPAGIENKQRATRPISGYRRQNLGTLVFTVKDNSVGTVPVGNDLFYPGQILEFGGVTDDQTLPHPGNVVEIQHDQHYIDGASVGITDTDMERIVQGATSTQAMLLIQLGDLQKRKDTLEAGISTQQSIINDANRVLYGVSVILEVDPANPAAMDVRMKVSATIEAAKQAIAVANAELMTLPDLIQAKRDQLAALATLVQ